MSQAKGKILIVEDDASIAKGLSHNLKYEGYETQIACRGDAAEPMVNDFCPDLIILDLMLPGLSGFEVLTHLRNAQNEVQVIVLSAKTREDDKVRALELGADDYITKPFGLREFLARIASAMRRVNARKSVAEAPITFDDITIYPNQKRVLKQDQPVHLTPRACELLIYFAQHPGRVYSRDDLLAKAWPDDYEGTARTVDNFVVQIRAQIENDPAHATHLVTIHGLGYRFDI